MTELERRALLGDRQAQEECTRKGIVLPCPCCGGKAKKSLVLGRFGIACTECPVCIVPSPYGEPFEENLKYWNTRTAPPIGRCKDCLHYFQMECLKIYDDGNASKDARQERQPDDFCSYFRAAPQKGNCADCKNADNSEKCLLAGQGKPISTFCSGFKPKGGEENG